MIDTKTRLQWLMSQLDNLNNGGNIRYDGNTTFQGARAELADIIATYVDHSGDPAPVVLQAMMPDQVQSVIVAMRDEIERSDVSVLDAVSSTRADLLGRLDSLAAPATPAAQ